MKKLESYSIREILFPEEDIKVGDFVASFHGSKGYQIDGIVDSVSPECISYHSLKFDWKIRNPKVEDVHFIRGIIPKEIVWGSIFLNPAEKSIVAGHSAYQHLSREGLLGQISLYCFFNQRRF